MPTHNFKDLTGQTFHRLTVIEKNNNMVKPGVYWNCKCSCGNIIAAMSHPLTSGRTKSCGCLARETTKKRSITHGMSYTREYNIWNSMIVRCEDPNSAAFKNYGGRGITICDEWRYDFAAFYNHIGKRPSPKHSVDRINNNGNYEPGNVRWATEREQHNNTRRNHKITVHGHTMSIAEWARFVNMKKVTLITRIKKGWPPAKAVFQPVRHYSKLPHFKRTESTMS